MTESAIHARLREIIYDHQMENRGWPSRSALEAAAQILEEFDVLYKAEWTPSYGRVPLKEPAISRYDEDPEDTADVRPRPSVARWDDWGNPLNDEARALDVVRPKGFEPPTF